MDVESKMSGRGHSASSEQASPRPHAAPGAIALGLSLLLCAPALGQATERATIKVAAAAPGDEVVRRKSVAILLKVLSYDKRFQQRYSDGLQVGIIAVSSDPQSVRCADLTMRAFREFEGKRIKGKKIEARLLRVDSLAQVERSIREHRLNALFLSRGLEAMTPQLSALAAQLQIPVLACDATYVREGVAALAVEKGPDDKPMIYVNLRAAEAEGVSFDARVLKIAEIIR